MTQAKSRLHFGFRISDFGFQSPIRIPQSAILLLLLLAAPAVLAARALTVDGEAIEGDLVAIDATPAVELRVGGAARRIPCADLQAIELRAAEPSPARESTALVLRNGDRLLGTIQGGSGRVVAVKSPLFGAAEIPLQALARIELPAPQPSQPFQASEKLDRLLFRNSETLDGTIESVEPTGLKFRSDLLGQVDVQFDRLATIALAGQAGAAPKPPEEGVHAIIHAADGTVVTGQLKGLRDGKLELQAHFGAPLALGLDSLLRIEFRGGRLVYLSDLEPAEVKETPMFDLVWHYRRDRSVDGNPLCLRGRVYRKGLGVHSRCELTYDLGGAYRRFLSDVGIDKEEKGKDELREDGNVDVKVLVDGKVLFERKGLTARDGPVPIDIDLTGAKRLTLLVDFGDKLDICDHADWAAARLIR